MSDAQKPKLPDNLPHCECFRTSDEYAWARCGDVGNINYTMGEAFHQLVEHEHLCPSALMFALETTISSLLAYVAKAQNPTLKYGTVEIEHKSELLLAGLEARVLASARHAYKGARAAGLTEENVRALRESRGETKQ